MSKITHLFLLILRITTLPVFFIIFILTSFTELYDKILKTPKNVENQVIMITGTGNGLGRELAKRFAKLGSKIALIDVNKKSNEATLEEIRKISSNFIKAYTCDVSKPEQIRTLSKAIADDFGRIDVLISNAGVLACHKITEGADADIQRVLDVNLLSNFWIVREFLKLLQNQGQLVFINSAAAIHGLGQASSYAASKAGLMGLVYSLKNELGKNPATRDLKITTVYPSFFPSHSSMKNAIDAKAGWLEIESVADEIIDGIRRELFTFCVAEDFLLSTLFRQLPIGVYGFLLDKYLGGIRTEAQPVFL